MQERREEHVFAISLRAEKFAARGRRDETRLWHIASGRARWTPFFNVRQLDERPGTHACYSADEYEGDSGFPRPVAVLLMMLAVRPRRTGRAP